METLIQDIRYGCHMLVKSPGFTAVAVITLALGIGANTAIFSVINAVLLRPLPYKNSDRLTVILHDGRNPVAPANLFDWQKQNHSFESMGAAEYWTPNVSGTGNAEKLWALRITSEVLPMLGVQPILGRFFTPQEQEPGREHEAVIGYEFWQSHFAGNAQVIGQSITLNGETYSVIGVMPRGFKFTPFWATRAQLWAPLALGDRIEDRHGRSLRIFARLRPGVSLAQAQAEMATITARLEQAYPGTNDNIRVLSLKEKVVGNVRPALLVLLIAVGFVLLIACANVAHMLLARSAARHKEIAIRTALGAARARVIQQFLTESLCLALVGSGSGLLLSFWGIRALVAMSPADLPRVETVTLDSHVFMFVLGITLVSGLAFGLAPALRASAPNLSNTLKEGGRGSSEGIRHNRLRSLLVASEFAFALVLLVGAGLMIRSFFAMQNIDPGFNPRNLLSVVVSVSGTKEAAPGERPRFYQELVERISQVPGVQSASAINHLPLGGDIWGWPFHVDGQPIPLPSETPTAAYRVVLPGYFRTMNIPLLNGRDISDYDALTAPGVVVVNEFFARRYWPNEDAIGKHFTFDDLKKGPKWVTVVGVAKNTLRAEWTAAQEEEVFLPYLQNRDYLENPASQFAYLTLVVRSSNPAALVPVIRGMVGSLDKNVALSEVQTMDQVVGEATAEPRFYLLLLATFAAVALTLAGVGIYGVMSYSVSRRTQEIGIRMALGAQPVQVIRMVVGQGGILATVGVVAGLIGALAVTRLMSGLLYGVRPNDPITFIAVAAGLSGVALIASYIPARRAAKVDPMVALRDE
ncbi:MAG TPA: ABC transporter permease [Candidatus Dormibacteraeota bacterium]|nr:ABC transporter permease [Candidatus Dormibacteraeota bacterium]